MVGTDESVRQVADALASVMRRRREAAGLNQVQMAERAGMDPKHYQAMENGFVSYRDRKPSNPRLDRLISLAHGFGTTVPDLMAEVFSQVTVEFDPDHR